MRGRPRERRTLLLTLALGFTVGALAGCGDKAQEEVETSAPVPVAVAVVQRGAIHRMISATGTIKPEAGADFMIVPPQAARIAALPHGTGDRVRRGDLLVRFEIPALDAEAAARHADVQRAAARLAQAQSSDERLRGLFERGIAARREVDDARRELAEASAGADEAKSAETAAAVLTARATVRAPFDGIVAERHHSQGDLVEPTAEAVLRFIDPARLEVEVGLPADEVSRVVVGGRAEVRGAGGIREPARVLTAPAALDPTTMSAILRLGFENPTRLAAGTPVEVAISGEEHRDALLVPAAAIVQEGPESFVYTVDAEKHAHRQKVAIGITDGAQTEIMNGVLVGAQVIVEGQNGLPDGALVALPSLASTSEPR